MDKTTKLEFIEMQNRNKDVVNLVRDLINKYCPTVKLFSYAEHGDGITNGIAIINDWYQSKKEYLNGEIQLIYNREMLNYIVVFNNVTTIPGEIQNVLINELKENQNKYNKFDIIFKFKFDKEITYEDVRSTTRLYEIVDMYSYGWNVFNNTLKIYPRFESLDALEKIICLILKELNCMYILYVYRNNKLVFPKQSLTSEERRDLINIINNMDFSDEVKNKLLNLKTIKDSINIRNFFRGIPSTNIEISDNIKRLPVGGYLCEAKVTTIIPFKLHLVYANGRLLNIAISDKLRELNVDIQEMIIYAMLKTKVDRNLCELLEELKWKP